MDGGHLEDQERKGRADRRLRKQTVMILTGFELLRIDFNVSLFC